MSAFCEGEPRELDELARARARIAELEGALAESHRTTDGLREAKQWLETLLAHAPDSIIVVSPDGKMLYSNRAAAGNRIEDVIGASALRYILPEQVARVRRAFETVAATGKSEFLEATTVFQTIWDTRIIRLPGSDTPPKLMVIGTEVTDRKRAEEAFRWSEERGRIAAQAARMGLWSWEAEESGLALDATSAAMLGLPSVATRASLQDCMAALHPDDRARVIGAARTFSSHGVLQDLEVRVVLPHGTTRWLLASGRRAIRENTGAVALIGSLFDVTERRRLEEQLRQAQKMEAIGELTAGIAHNFNNLLTAIIPGIQLAIAKPGPLQGEWLRDAEYGARRAAELVQELMLFARHGKSAPRSPVDVRELLSRTVSMCRATFDDGLAIELVDSPTVSTVDGQGSQLEQVFLNICFNARDALDVLDASATKDRRLRIELDAVLDEAAASDLGWLRIRFSDNGAGMSDDVRARIFEPFFTTKETGRGTGLGLASAYAIVSDHGGKLLCESTLGVGTTFTVLLPASGGGGA